MGILLRYNGGDPFAVDTWRQEGFEACAEDGFGELGIFVDNIVKLVEGVKDGERRLREKCPVFTWERVEGLSADVGPVEMSQATVGAVFDVSRCFWWTRYIELGEACTGKNLKQREDASALLDLPWDRNRLPILSLSFLLFFRFLCFLLIFTIAVLCV